MIKKHIIYWASYVLSVLRWILLAAIIGGICGLIGAGFHALINYATEVRGANPWTLYFLPAAGIIIVLMYHLAKQPITLGTDVLFNSIHNKSRVPIAMAPLVYVSTFITHFFGGSAGREGAALQLGGSIGNGVGSLFRLDENDKRTMTLLGMGALFAALFGTPLAATFFVMEVLALGHMIYSCLVPCIVASMTAYGVSLLLNVKPESFTPKTVPELSWLVCLQVGVLAILCAALSVLFCKTMHVFNKGAKKLLKNSYLRIALGGALIVVLTLLVGTRDYNGAGGNVIARAIEEGAARPWDFALKLLFTAITLSCGFKGGEIVPTFYVGATFGCVVGPLLGLDPGFAAAVALAATFCGNTNCPIASIFLSIELFGAKAVPLFVIACAVSFMLSGTSSLYHSQLVLERDLKFGSMIIPERQKKNKKEH